MRKFGPVLLEDQHSWTYTPRYLATIISAVFPISRGVISIEKQMSYQHNTNVIYQWTV